MTNRHFHAEKVGAAHNRVLENISESLTNIQIDTMKGLYTIVDLLVKNNIVQGDDVDLLRDVVPAISDPGMRAKMASAVEQIYDKAKEKAKPVTVAIIGVVNSSIEFAKKHPKAIGIVAKDFVGAMSGVLAVVEGGPAFWVLGALAGGVGGSALAYSETTHADGVT